MTGNTSVTCAVLQRTPFGVEEHHVMFHSCEQAQQACAEHPDIQFLGIVLEGEFTQLSIE